MDAGDAIARDLAIRAYVLARNGFPLNDHEGIAAALYAETGYAREQIAAHVCDACLTARRWRVQDASGISDREFMADTTIEIARVLAVLYGALLAIWLIAKASAFVALP